MKDIDIFELLDVLFIIMVPACVGTIMYGMIIVNIVLTVLS